MPRVCTVCTHPERQAIDTALVAGESFRYVSERFGPSATALFRHKAEHMPAALTKAQGAQEAAQADDLLGQVRTLQTRTLAILDRAETAGDLPTALRAIGEARRNLELLARLSGELDERAQVNILVAPEWLAMRALLFNALAPYPEAKVAVAGALATLEAAG